MIRPRSNRERSGDRYGLGFWLHASNDTVFLQGADPGVSFWAAHRPTTGTAFTVVSNWSDGAWPLVRLLAPPLDD